MEDKISERQALFISYLLNTMTFKYKFIDVLQKIEEERGATKKMMCDVTQMKFEEWTETLNKQQAKALIGVLLASDVKNFKNLLNEYGYYIWARREHVRIHGMVDELDYVYL